MVQPGQPKQAASAAGYYGIYFHPDSAVSQAFAGSTILWTSSGAPAKNDLAQVTYDGFTFRYYYNGNLVASLQQQGLSLYIVASFYSGVLSNIETTVGALATPSQWVATGYCTVSDTNAMKQGGGSLWDSAVYSVIGYQTCHVTGKANVAGGGMLVCIGLSNAPTIGNGLNNCWVLANYSGSFGNVWTITEAATEITHFGAVSATDVVWMTYDGTNIRYYINDPATAVHTTAVSSQTLYGFCPFRDPGAGPNSLRFGPTGT